MLANTDVRCDADGSIVVITPLTAVGREWINENLETESWQWLGGGLCIEHRYVSDIITGMREEGLSVSTANCYAA